MTVASATLAKEKSHAFGKDVYLLGRDKYGKRVWLEAPKWDCDWYWAFGYVETYQSDREPSNARDIDSQQHFDGFVFRKEADGNYIAHWNESPDVSASVLTERESWELSDLMKSFYTLKGAAEVFHSGNSNLTGSGKLSLKDAELAKTINQTVLPKLFARVIEILTPTE